MVDKADLMDWEDKRVGHPHQTGGIHRDLQQVISWFGDEDTKIYDTVKDLKDKARHHSCFMIFWILSIWT